MKQTMQVTGLRFHEYKSVADQLTPGIEVGLERQPSNKYDINAISVHFDGKQIGWIPKVCNTLLAMLLDEGKQYTATVVSNSVTFTARNPAGLYIEVVVY